MAGNKAHFDTKHLVKAIGLVPWNFMEGTRLLLADHQAGRQTPSPRAMLQVSRLLQSKTVFGCLTQLCQEFYPEQLTGRRIDRPGDLVSSMDPMTLAVALMLVYLYKRCKGICASEEWKYLDEFFTRNCEIALRLGLKVPEIGGGIALLSEGFLHVALSILLSVDKAGFQQYRRHLKKQKVRFDPAFETATWGCTCAELAALLLVTCGFKTEFALGLEEGMSLKPVSSKESARIRMYSMAVEVLQDYPARSASLPKEIEKLTPVLAELGPKASLILNDGAITPWLDKTRADGEAAELSVMAPAEAAQAAPESPAPAGEAAAPDSAAAAPVKPETFIAADGREIPILSHYQDLPENLRKEISEEEFKQLQHMPLEEVIALLGG